MKGTKDSVIELQETTPAVMLTVTQLRQLLREEIGRLVAPRVAGVEAEQPPAYLTVEQAADVSSLAPSTIRLHIRKGGLKASKVGRRVIISRTELERFLRVNPTGLIVH